MTNHRQHMKATNAGSNQLCIIESLESEISRLKKPFNTYPEDREKMLELCRVVLKPSSDSEEFERAAVELADLVAAILTDEAAYAALAFAAKM